MHVSLLWIARSCEGEKYETVCTRITQLNSVVVHANLIVGSVKTTVVNITADDMTDTYKLFCCYLLCTNQKGTGCHDVVLVENVIFFCVLRNEIIFQI